MIFHIATFFLLLLFIFNSPLKAEVNLEDNIQKFVLKTKQIKIPEFPHAFNPSIIQFNDKLLMSFRVLTLKDKISETFNSSGCSLIGLIFLDDDFNPIGKPQILNLGSRSEDARLIKVSGKFYLVYSNNQEEFLTERGFRMYISELKKDDTGFSIVHTDSILSFEGENEQRREKNWVPFDYQGNLMLAYSLLPHRIFYSERGTTHAFSFSLSKSDINWNYGELRGGTPALLDGDEYLSFFHSSKNMSTVHSQGEEMPHYFMGAYTFSQHPPFEITKISPEPIVCYGFYEGRKYKPYWKPVRVVFPCGYIMNEHYIYISYGRQDHEIWILKLDKHKLKNSLISV